MSNPSPHDDHTMTSSLVIRAACEGDLDFFRKLEVDTGNQDVFRQICGSAQSNPQRMKAIHHAAAKGKIDICNFFIERVEIDVNVQDKRGNNALMFAAHYGHTQLVDYLITSGADINVCNNWGLNALSLAIQKERWEIMRLLMTRGANTNSMILKAVEDGNLEFLERHKELVRLLLQKGSKPYTTPPQSSEPPIAGTIMSGVKLVMEAGVDPNKFADLRRSPLGYQDEQGDPKIIKELPDMMTNVKLSDKEEINPPQVRS